LKNFKLDWMQSVAHPRTLAGSQGELEVQLEIAQRLGFAAQRDIDPVASRAGEVGRMLNGLIEALQFDRSGP